jgi:hypothetical protein
MVRFAGDHRKKSANVAAAASKAILVASRVVRLQTS